MKTRKHYKDCKELQPMVGKDEGYVCICFDKPQHTPTPWSVDALGYLRGPDSENILEVKENAAFIVRAVNSHEELVQLLRRIREFDRHTPLLGTDMVQDIERAIAKAEGK